MDIDIDVTREGRVVFVVYEYRLTRQMTALALVDFEVHFAAVEKTRLFQRLPLVLPAYRDFRSGSNRYLQSCDPAAFDLRTVRCGLIYRLAMEADGVHGEIRTHTPIRAPGSESGTSSVSSHAHMA